MTIAVLAMFFSLAADDKPKTETQTLSEKNETALNAQLDRKLPEVIFNQNSMKDVFDFFSEVSGANVFIDRAALDSVGVAIDAPVKYRAKDVPFRDAVTAVLKSAGRECQS